jgi:hypothetical protein
VGDANHAPSTDSKTFTIDKAASTTAVTCPTNVTYDGSAQTPCTAKVTGAGGLDQALAVSYSNNTNAGTATASASYTGDANHAPSTDSKTFTIDKAGSTTAVTCLTNVTYNGLAQTPCTASFSTTDGLSGALTVNYTNNTNAGTATASASYTGDANHSGSSDSKNFTINKANQTITVTTHAPASAIYNTTFSVAATGGASGNAVTFSSAGACSNVGATFTMTSGTGTCTVKYDQVGNSNYNAAPQVTETTSALPISWSNVLQPINLDGSSIFKLGSTVPTKFALTGASSGITNLSAHLYLAKLANGVNGTELEAVSTAAADSGNTFRYDSTANQYIFNLNTKSLSEGTWQLRIDLGDSVNHTVLISLRK